MADGESVRMTINFPPQTTARLKRLKEYLEATSFVAVIRVALWLLETCVNVVRDGGTIVSIDKEGKQRTIAIPAP